MRLIDRKLQRDPDTAVAHIEDLVARAESPDGKRLLRGWLALAHDRAGHPAERWRCGARCRRSRRTTAAAARHHAAAHAVAGDGDAGCGCARGRVPDRCARLDGRTPRRRAQWQRAVVPRRPFRRHAAAGSAAELLHAAQAQRRRTRFSRRRRKLARRVARAWTAWRVIDAAVVDNALLTVLREQLPQQRC